MNTVLDENLLYLTKRKPRKDDGLTPAEIIAINLFWRKNVKIPIIARAFGRAKNTIYYKCLTGQAASYPKSMWSNRASDTNDLIERLGFAEAWRRYVTPEMVEAVNVEMAKEVKARDARASSRNRRRPKARLARS